MNNSNLIEPYLIYSQIIKILLHNKINLYISMNNLLFVFNYFPVTFSSSLKT